MPSSLQPVKSLPNLLKLCPAAKNATDGSNGSFLWKKPSISPPPRPSSFEGDLSNREDLLTKASLQQGSSRRTPFFVASYFSPSPSTTSSESASPSQKPTLRETLIETPENEISSYSSSSETLETLSVSSVTSQDNSPHISICVSNKNVIELIINSPPLNKKLSIGERICNQIRRLFGREKNPTPAANIPTSIDRLSPLPKRTDAPPFLTTHHIEGKDAAVGDRGKTEKNSGILNWLTRQVEKLFGLMRKSGQYNPQQVERQAVKDEQNENPPFPKNFRLGRGKYNPSGVEANASPEPSQKKIAEFPLEGLI